MSKTVLILGANADVAKEALAMFVRANHFVIAASRNLEDLKRFVSERSLPATQVDIRYFDAVDYTSHAAFYDTLPAKPNIVVYAAGYLKQNEEAMRDWEGSFRMMQVHYCGAVSILNIVVNDQGNTGLERIVGLSSLSGVRGRRSNFIYGSTKSAFTQYLAGLRQYLFSRRITVNVIVAGYIRTKMTSGLNLPESLMLEPSFIARTVVKPSSRLIIVPGLRWKAIYHILRILPESLVARLP